MDADTESARIETSITTVATLNQLADELSRIRQIINSGINLGDALLSLSRILSSEPAFSESYSLLSAAATLVRANELAIWSAQRATQLNPEDAAAFTNLALHQHGRERLEYLHRAVALAPNDSNALFHLANDSTDGDKKDRESLYQWVLRTEPLDIDARINLAALKLKQEPLEAQRELQMAYCLAPNHPLALSNLSAVALELHDASHALRAAERSSKLNRKQSASWLNLAMALKLCGNALGGLAALNRALTINPADARAWTNTAALLEAASDPSRDENCYQRAIEINPLETTPRFNLGLSWLRRGRFRDGWRLYELRQKNAAARELEIKFTGIRALKSKTEIKHGQQVLLVAEQGLGDVIQFFRFCKTLHSLGAEITLFVPTALQRLFRHLPVAILSDMETVRASQYDFWCFIPSLPAICETDLADITGESYLTPDPQDVCSQRSRLTSKKRPTVGIAWRGSARGKQNPREIDLHELLRELPSNITLIPLHHDLTSDETATLMTDDRAVALLTPSTDFADAAAVIEACDLVISIDTSLAHLSGAVGQKTWLLLPRHGDWRWMSGDTSPWYRSIKIFRQQHSNSWSEVLAQIREELGEITRSTSPQPN
jgi:tetratricopeptide (TPR) repeat protein